MSIKHTKKIKIPYNLFKLSVFTLLVIYYFLNISIGNGDKEININNIDINSLYSKNNGKNESFLNKEQFSEFPNKTDEEYFLNYSGGELEPEWQWAKKISIVYTWVNGNDIDYLDMKSKFNGGLREYNSRDQSADELRYSLRSITKYLPWHEGKIYILTNDQIPEWFEVDNPKVKIIFHKDIFPDHVYPTYDSNTIELYLDKIPGITDRFIYFNDDVFVNQYLHPSFLFTSKDFYLKSYRNSSKPNLSKDKINNIIKNNDIHLMYTAQCYFTDLVIKKYFDKNFHYKFLEHQPHIFYRDLFEPFRQLFSEEIKNVVTDRFRNSYKVQIIYLYYTFVEYASKHKEFPKKYGGYGLAQNITGYDLPENNNIKSFSAVTIVPSGKNNKYVYYAEIRNNYKKNKKDFDTINNKENNSILVYNLNDKYTKVDSLYQFTEFIINKYPNPNSFEKEEYIKLDNDYLLKYNEAKLYFKSLSENIEFKGRESMIEEFNKYKNFDDYKRDLIKKYFNDKNELSGHEKLISDRENNEISYLLKYKGEELNEEWNWAKDISIVYIWENSNFENTTTIVNELKYSLRSIDSYLPWFEGNIYIISQKESTPELAWLNLSPEDSKIRIIHQNKILPQKYYNTENKHIVQMYLDKIPGLSEKYIYLNVHHYFINYSHPRFFFSNDFSPKYNLEEPLTKKEINMEREDENKNSFFSTYSILHDYFNANYITTYRHFIDAPFPFYRDLYEPIRELFNDPLDEIFSQMMNPTDNNKNNSPEILPFYLISNYNIYGTAQPIYPNYVSGYGKIRDAKLPILNSDRTVTYYGFDITSKAISESTMILDANLNNITDIKAKIEDGNKLFISIDFTSLEDTKNNNSLNDLINFMNSIFKRKSRNEI